MKFLYDFFPILLFFIAYKLEGIYVATAVIIVSSFIQIAFFWIKYRRFEKMHLITFAIVFLLGGATILLHNETFIKWKPTVINWLFALAFLVSQFIGSKPLIQRMLESSIKVTSNAVWTRLNVSWILFFMATGAANLYVAYQFDTDTWVNFKLFGLLSLTFLFIIGQSIYLMRYMVEEPQTDKTP